MKVHLTFGNDTKEGYVSHNPNYIGSLEPESVDEFSGRDVVEKVNDLYLFIEHCYRALKWGGTCSFVGQYYATQAAWTSPLVKRGISESSLNFSSKQWRDINNYSELDIIADFDVVGNFGLTDQTMCRSVEARQFQLTHYNNVVQQVLFTLTKTRREPVSETK